MTDKISAWLEGFALDLLEAGEGKALFPQGQRELRRQEDILGNVRHRKRLTVILRCHGDRALLEGLDLASAPLLGQEQTVRLEDVRLVARSHDGLPRYEGKLIFEFTERR